MWRPPLSSPGGRGGGASNGWEEEPLKPHLPFDAPKYSGGCHFETYHILKRRRSYITQNASGLLNHTSIVKSDSVGAASAKFCMSDKITRYVYRYILTI